MRRLPRVTYNPQLAKEGEWPWKVDGVKVRTLERLAGCRLVEHEDDTTDSFDDGVRFAARTIKRTLMDDAEALGQDRPNVDNVFGPRSGGGRRWVT